MSDSPKLRELIEELIEIKKKWYIIGLQLTIPEETLDKIEEISCDEDEALRRMLQEWRKLVDPSWAAVLEALRSRSVNEHCLAANLQEKYIDAERGSCESGGTTPANLQLVPSSTAGAHGSDQVVQQDLQRLHQSFEQLRMEVYRYIEETKPDRSEFAVFVSCPTPSWKKKCPKQMMAVDLERIMEPGTEFYQMFCVISQYTNWYDYELLDNIVQRYGNPKLKGKMATYCSELAEFESHTGADKLKDIVISKPLADSVAIIARLPDHRCNQFTGSDIRRLKHQYTNEAGLDPAALRTHMIQESSVQITFLVSNTLAPYLIVSSLQISPLLSSQQSLPEDIDERCVYYMRVEEVFRLMGRTVTPPATPKVSSASHTHQVSLPGPLILRVNNPPHTQQVSLPNPPILRSVSSNAFSESSRPSEMDEVFPPIDPSRIHVFHNKVLMNGDSAVVCKAQFLNLPCAAKYIHPKLVETSSWQLQKFREGCQILQKCRHPNIVSFLAIHSNNRLKQPILLMELMDQSLKQLIDQRKISFPLHQQLDICIDIAQGLEYLHAISIIHSNLIASNILVKGDRAKIGGLLSLQLIKPDGELLLCPGAPESMPRRSFVHTDYSEKLDCFSFGVIGIHIATQEQPKPHSHVRNLTEVERYENSLNKVNQEHCLHPLIIKCLNEVENQRPSATNLRLELATIRSTTYHSSQEPEHATELASLTEEFTCKQSEMEATNEALQRELKSKEVELDAASHAEDSLKNSLAMMTATNQDLTEKLQAATKKLDEAKKQKDENDRMCKDLWRERAKSQIMNDKIKELQKQRDDYKDKLEESDKSLARMLSQTP